MAADKMGEFKMIKLKDKKVILGMAVFFFIAGLLICLLGFKYGEKIAVNLSKPMGATCWSTSGKQINMVTYGVLAFGGLWIFISHVLFVLLVIRDYLFKPDKDA